MYYGRGWSKTNAIAAVVAGCIISGTLEAGFIFGSKALERQGNSGLTTTCGILSAVLITIGILPQYIEIYRYKAGKVQHSFPHFPLHFYIASIFF